MYRGLAGIAAIKGGSEPMRRSFDWHLTSGLDSPCCWFVDISHAHPRCLLVSAVPHQLITVGHTREIAFRFRGGNSSSSGSGFNILMS
jgi:hypothetical protein